MVARQHPTRGSVCVARTHPRQLAQGAPHLLGVVRGWSERAAAGVVVGAAVPAVAGRHVSTPRLRSQRRRRRFDLTRVDACVPAHLWQGGRDPGRCRASAAAHTSCAAAVRWHAGGVLRPGRELAKGRVHDDRLIHVAAVRGARRGPRRRIPAAKLAGAGLGLVARVVAAAAVPAAPPTRGRRVAEDGREDLELVVDLCKGRAVRRLCLGSSGSSSSNNGNEMAAAKSKPTRGSQQLASALAGRRDAPPRCRPRSLSFSLSFSPPPAWPPQTPPQLLAHTINAQSLTPHDANNQ